jgi:hypothetical protein
MGYVYSERPFGGPDAVLAYLSRYTHHFAISNRRLIAFVQNGDLEKAVVEPLHSFNDYQ